MMDAYRFYLIIPESKWDNLVPAHFGQPVDANFATYDPGNRDIIFGGWNRDVDGNEIDWRRPTWREVGVGVPGVHGPQVGGFVIWTYTYPDVSTNRYAVTKFVHPHLPAALPLLPGGHGLFSLYNLAKLSDNVTLVVNSTIQECINDKLAMFYADARKLKEWAQAEEDAGNLDRGE